MTMAHTLHIECVQCGAEFLERFYDSVDDFLADTDTYRKVEDIFCCTKGQCIRYDEDEEPQESDHDWYVYWDSKGIGAEAIEDVIGWATFDHDGECWF